MVGYENTGGVFLRVPRPPIQGRTLSVVAAASRRFHAARERRDAAATAYLTDILVYRRENTTKGEWR